MDRPVNRRVLFVNPPQELEAVMGDTQKFVSRHEPLGLLFMAGVLLDKGYDVQVIDAEADPQSLDEILDAVQAYDPAVVGITCLTPTAPPSVELGQRIRQANPHPTVVMGNIHASAFAETLLRLGACDYVVHGEGEFVFADLLDCLANGGDSTAVAGVSTLRDQTFVKVPPPALVQDLDVIPPPARHLLKHINYDSGGMGNSPYRHRRGTVGRHAMSSRGCVFECKFCVVHQERTFRSHSAARTVDEMVELQNNYNCGFLFFTDPLFVANKKRVYAICEEILSRGVRLPWGCEGHVRCVNRELLVAMKRAGCVTIAYGIESGSQRMLNHIGKTTKLQDVTAAVAMTRSVGIPVSGLFILGLPDETRSEMEQTLEFARSLRLDFAQFSMFVPYPGSQDFNELSKAGAIDTGVRADGSVDLEVWKRYSPYVGYGSAGDSIYLPPDVTFDELYAMQRRALRQFYLRPSQILRNLRRIRPDNIRDVVRAGRAVFFGSKRQPSEQRRVLRVATAQKVDVLTTPTTIPLPILNDVPSANCST